MATNLSLDPKLSEAAAVHGRKVKGAQGSRARRARAVQRAGVRHAASCRARGR